MTATEIHTWDDVCLNLENICDGFLALDSLITKIEEYRSDAAVILAFPVPDDDRNELLKRLTGFTVGLDPDINCYPRGLALTTCFDLDGNPI